MFKCWSRFEKFFSTKLLINHEKSCGCIRNYMQPHLETTASGYPSACLGPISVTRLTYYSYQSYYNFKHFMLFLLRSHLAFLTVLSEYLNVFDILRLLQVIKMWNADLSFAINTDKFKVKILSFLSSVRTIIFITFGDIIIKMCFDICWGTR